MKLVILISAILLTACMQANPSKPTQESTEEKLPADNQIMCTMDAMQCSDGSWVGRTGPNCEFACLKAPAK